MSLKYNMSEANTMTNTMFSGMNLNSNIFKEEEKMTSNRFPIDLFTLKKCNRFKFEQMFWVKTMNISVTIIL